MKDGCIKENTHRLFGIEFQSASGVTVCVLEEVLHLLQESKPISTEFITNEVGEVSKLGLNPS